MRFEFDEASDLCSTEDRQALCQLGSYTIHESNPPLASNLSRKRAGLVIPVAAVQPAMPALASKRLCA
ncbi:hypothetical protein RGR602_CH02732 [Rhizobium gallicum bv. gallicum R602sp]|uniref:Uncharacterized protein n=1 Tax=Rhizobium gallicum bv. gallicum R602sp TaxID=1041138 RepID=A0A0B4X6E0_9HYPH|nr:hypothetical protein RGR602_CH02732 [Rhizobium gallicum bv. gallicum R602sp]TDW26788.1 hypothetical protein EV128_113119 [Rhizobium azibense]